MSLPWIRRRKTAPPALVPALAGVPAAASVAEFAQPRGRHARPEALDAPVAYDTSYDDPGWGDAERELLMPATAARRGEPDLGELTLTDKPLAVLRPETAPERTTPGPDLAAAAQDRPYVPQDGGLPSAWLRAVPMAGPGSRVLETLTGMPFYAGKRDDGDAEGLCLGAAGDIWLILDTSAEVLDALEAAVRAARDNRVYGRFRAPVVQPDPDAAEHVEVLERELDAIEAESEAAGPAPAVSPGTSSAIEWARAVLGRADHSRFAAGASHAAAQAAYQCRIELRRHVASYDKVLADDEPGLAAWHDALAAIAADATGMAASLIAAVRDLAGKEAADFLARGEVPAAEAEAEIPAAPEPAAGDEPEPAEVAAAAEAGSQDGTEAAA